MLGELGLSLDQVLAFEKRHKDKYNFIYKPALIYEHIDTMLDNKLLEDRRVRQAILTAIDRKAISEKLFEGKNPIADGPISPLDPMFSPNTRHYPYDAAAARKLLDEAGFSDIKNGVRHNAKGDRLSLEITTTAGNRVRELVTQVIQSQLRQVGIELRIKAEPPRVFSEGLNRRQFPALAMYAWVQSPEGVPRTLLYSDRDPVGRRTPGAARTIRATATPPWTPPSTAPSASSTSTSAARSSPTSSASMPRTCRCCRCSSASIPSSSPSSSRA